MRTEGGTGEGWKEGAELQVFTMKKLISLTGGLIKSDLATFFSCLRAESSICPTNHSSKHQKGYVFA